MTTKGESKRLVELYRLAAGLPTERKPEEIRASERAVAKKYPIVKRVGEKTPETQKGVGE